MPRTQGFSDPEYSAEYSAEYSVSLPSDPERGVGRTHEISVRNSGSCLCLPRFMRLTFVPESLENLYQTYFKRQRHETLLVLVVFAALFDCYVVVMCAVVFSSDKLAPLAVAGVGLVLDLILFVLCRKGLLPSRVTRKGVPYLLWLLITAQVLSYLGLNFSGAHAASDTVGWQAFFVFSFFITLPLSLSPIVLISVLSCVVHTLVLGVTVAQQQQDGLRGMQLLREVRCLLPHAAASLPSRSQPRWYLFRGWGGDGAVFFALESECDLGVGRGMAAGVFSCSCRKAHPPCNPWLRNRACVCLTPQDGRRSGYWFSSHFVTGPVLSGRQDKPPGPGLQGDIHVLAISCP